MLDKTYKSRTFISNCKGLCSDFIATKRALGCKYLSEEGILAQFDHFLTLNFPSLPTNEISAEAIELWETKRAHESPKTHSSRMLVVRKLCEYASQRGHNVFISSERGRYKNDINFVPYIYSSEELRRFFEAVDTRNYKTAMLATPLFYPTLFRILVCCGLRLMEGVSLLVRDVDLKEKALFIRNAKFGKERIVPFGDELAEAIQKYLQTSHHTKPEDYLFTSPYGGRYNGKTVGAMFREILREAGIEHHGRGKGPRIHDFRHTFAVNCLQRWTLEGTDLSEKLSVLSAYLGHADLRGTQRYLRLTSHMYPHITKQFSNKFGYIFPEVCKR